MKKFKYYVWICEYCRKINRIKFFGIKPLTNIIVKCVECGVVNTIKPSQLKKEDK